ncbi:MAG: kinase/pyrophosphorylase [Clostridium sp.]|nr:kinase/pyrophosphorylase [Clostridium sp.]
MVTIYAVSDSIGESAKEIAEAAASQFDSEIKVIRVGDIKSVEAADKFIDEIEDSENSVVISTILKVDVRKALTKGCIRREIAINNILGPSIDIISKVLNREPDYKPEAVWNMDSKNYEKIKSE